MSEIINFRDGNNYSKGYFWNGIMKYEDKVTFLFGKWLKLETFQN